jgi:hypothetical protein
MTLCVFVTSHSCLELEPQRKEMMQEIYDSEPIIPKLGRLHWQ